MHISLDGFVAGPNGEMDWITVDSEIFDYAGHCTKEADMALYGRKTWEMMDGYWPTAGDPPDASKHDKEHSEWYNRVTKIVISRSMKGQDRPKTKFISDDLAKNVNQIKQQGEKDILIFGSPGASHALMNLDLIDEYWLFVNPVLLGNGIPMFKDIAERTKLKLVMTKAFKTGVVCLQYLRERK